MIDEVKRQVGEHGRGDVDGVVDEIARVRVEFEKEWGPRLRSDEVPLSPYRVISELAANVDAADAIVTHDSGYPREQLVPFWQTVTPRGYIGWGKSTQLGYGLGLVLGAKLAAPEKTVVNIMGDAAFGMSGLDIETAARNEIGTLTIVLNNSVMTNYSHHMPYATEQYGSKQLLGRVRQGVRRTWRVQRGGEDAGRDRPVHPSGSGRDREGPAGRTGDDHQRGDGRSQVLVGQGGDKGGW